MPEAISPVKIFQKLKAACVRVS